MQAATLLMDSPRSVALFTKIFFPFGTGTGFEHVYCVCYKLVKIVQIHSRLNIGLRFAYFGNEIEVLHVRQNQRLKFPSILVRKFPRGRLFQAKRI